MRKCLNIKQPFCQNSKISVKKSSCFVGTGFPDHWWCHTLSQTFVLSTILVFIAQKTNLFYINLDWSNLLLTNVTKHIKYFCLCEFEWFDWNFCSFLTFFCDSFLDFEVMMEKYILGDKVVRKVLRKVRLFKVFEKFKSPGGFAKQPKLFFVRFHHSLGNVKHRSF